jgi:Tol biopolymer transport system component
VVLLGLLAAACGDVSGTNGEPPYQAMIAYARFDLSGSLGVYTVSAEGPMATPTLAEGHRATWLDWSPSGRFLAYTANGRAIFIVDVEDLARSYTLRPHASGVVELPMWSPDGARIAYRYQNDIWVVDAAGGAPVNVSRNSSGSALFPDWSPDGTRIVYGQGDELWIATADGDTRSRIPISGHAQFPRWSPEGDRIAFHYGGIWSVAPDGSDRRALTPNCDVNGECDWTSKYEYAQWSPDAGRLVFFGRPDMNLPDRQLFVVDADGTNMRQLTQGYDNQDPQWAPDGRRIVFWRSRGIGGNDLFSMQVDRLEERQLTTAKAWHAFPRWRP